MARLPDTVIVDGVRFADPWEQYGLDATQRMAVVTLTADPKVVALVGYHATMATARPARDANQGAVIVFNHRHDDFPKEQQAGADIVNVSPPWWS